MQIRYVNGIKCRFEPNSRELFAMEELKAQLAPVEISEAEMADMLDGIPADKVERARGRIVAAHEANEATRIAAVKAEIERMQGWFEQLASRGQSVESVDTGYRVWRP